MDVREEEDVEMMLPVVLGMDTFRSMVDSDSTHRADHKDSPFLVGDYRVIIFLGMYGWM